MGRAPSGWDPRLAGLLGAKDRRAAERRIDELLDEIVGRVVEAVIKEETDGRLPSSHDELNDEADMFDDLSVIARGRIAVRLVRLWESFTAGDESRDLVANVVAYSVATARNVCVDYLRHERPGRHSLDNSLRAILTKSSDLDIWRIVSPERHIDWRCGRTEWRNSDLRPVALPESGALASQLRSALEGLTRPECVRRIFDVAAAPLRFHELVSFLADYLDVEQAHRLAQAGMLPFRLGKPYQHLQPEEVVEVMGTLQAIWREVSRLAPNQAAVLVLKLPRLPGLHEGNALDLMVSFGIASWEEVASVLGMAPEGMARISSRVPLDDDRIAEVLGISGEDVPRIRQDARRRLLRRRERYDRNRERES